MLSNLILSLFDTVSAVCLTGNCGPNYELYACSDSSSFMDGSSPEHLFIVPAAPAAAPAAEVKAFYGADITNACTGALLPPIAVKSFDYLRNGSIISRYRRCMKKNCNKFECEFKEPFIFCTKKSLCKCLTKEQFCSAVHATIRIISGKRCVYIPEKAEAVIESIYCAAVECGATVEQLINFTAISLHNVYLFTYFPRPNFYDTSIGCTTRGLLQLLSLNAYEKITSVSEIDYLQKPFLLDTFTRVTIHDEFRTFLRFYNNYDTYGIESFITSVHLLQSREAELVNIKSAIEVLNGTYRPRNILEERVLHRFNIYFVLTNQIFSRPRVLGPKAYEN
ncbi:uncharacterized protein VICG_01556 [Vittaforma corneae ATCC 50505]|uniref:Uncharacterized protein n=1 Tax=Vittaforma corneae (strain ATCC 50505) TaxID=993615 RepID=L2GKR9_VITCO|nr:uncharacterized protein VICG_01556 [Vittaforma corneae ATCC 50505]ELA41451.1 hypothetical protein VICG_01556 [Vittaforma corneae ATCC 50505]